MTEDEIIDFVAALPGVQVLTASAANGAPEAAWGDTFFSYLPVSATRPGDLPDAEGPDSGAAVTDQPFPFATIVVSDYDGFDTASELNRDGVFRVNVAVGRRVFTELLGYGPSAHPEHSADVDYTVLDRVLPHPVYATQAWVSILNPGPATAEQTRTLLTLAHTRAAQRRRIRG